METRLSRDTDVACACVFLCVLNDVVVPLCIPVHGGVWTHAAVSERRNAVTQPVQVVASEPCCATFIECKTMKEAASDIIRASTPVWSFAYLPASAQFDPTDRVHRCLVPTDDDIAAVNTWSPPYCGESNQLLPFLESNYVHGALKARLGKHWQSGPSLKSTACLGISWGIPDLSKSTDDLMMACWENKGGEASLLTALRQNALYGSTVAMNLFAAGFPIEDVIVPLVCSNGLHIQFAATYLLPPSYPVFMPVSNALNLADVEGCRHATAFLGKIDAHVERMSTLIRRYASRKLSVPPSMLLDLQVHYVKELQRSELDRGIGLFYVPSDKERGDVYEKTVAAGISHMMYVLSALYKHERSRAVTVFPLAVLSPQGNGSSYSLVFENLCRSDYRIGTPHRKNDEETYNAYVKALRSAVQSIHDAGVVHLDLYSSK